MSTKKMEMRFKKEYLDDLTQQLSRARVELLGKKSFPHRNEQEVLVKKLEDKIEAANNYFDKQEKFMYMKNGILHVNDTVSINAFNRNYANDLRNDIYKLKNETQEKRDDNEKIKGMTGHDSTSHSAAIQENEKRLQSLQNKLDIAAEIEYKKEQFFKEQSLGGKTKAKLADFSEKFTGRKLTSGMREQVNFRSKLVETIKEVASQVKADKEAYEKNPTKAGAELIVAKKAHIIELLKEVERCGDRTRDYEPTKAQMKTLDKEKNKAENELRKSGIMNYNETKIEDTIIKHETDVLGDIKGYEKQLHMDMSSWEKKVLNSDSKLARAANNSVIAMKNPVMNKGYGE